MTNQPTIVRQGMALDEYLRRYAQEGRFEFLEGEVVELSPNVMRHVVVTSFLEEALKAVAHKLNKGMVFREAPFVLIDQSNWVRGSQVPDVMFITAERFEEYTKATSDWLDKPLALVPDIVIEVVSPSDSMSEVDRKVDLYLSDGVKIVWVVLPKGKKVHVHTAGSRTITVLQGDDTLSGGDILPEFSVKVATIFDECLLTLKKSDKVLTGS